MTAGRRVLCRREGARCRAPVAPLRGRTRAAGSATVELVAIAPFVLAITAVIWDLREYVSYRTDLARQMYAVAEIIANEPDTNPIRNVMREVMEEFAPVSAGRVAVAIVARGTERATREPCADAAAWCLPRVLAAWPPDPEDGTWNDVGNRCAGLDNAFPAPGAHFTSGRSVLPNENPDGSAAEQAWISRNMAANEWWVVIDSCFVPGPGLFWGRLTGMRDLLFDVSAFPLRSRAAWGSVHDLGDCAWCGGNA